MFRARTILSALVLVILAQAFQATVANAQSPPLWDRKAEGIIVRPIPGGGGTRFTIQPMFRVSAQPTSIPLDLSTLVEININGTTVDVLEFTLKTDPTGAAGCNTPCHEMGQVCVCLEGVICSCGTILVCDPPINASLVQGDEITVILRPAPDARPEISEGNDKRTLVWNGRPTVWERRVASIEKKPSATIRGGTDVQVAVGVIVNHDGVLNLDTELELRVNGRPAASGNADVDEYTWSSCAIVCKTSACGASGDSPSVNCQIDPEVGADTCWCNGNSVGTYVFKGVKHAPGDEITVILKPAPGSLPDLPRPVETKPAVKFRRGDANGDGTVNMADGVFTLSYRFSGTEAPACFDAADANDDGDVNIGDPIFLFGWLFLGGKAPPAPGPMRCGEDPTEDRLPEGEYEECGLTN